MLLENSLSPSLSNLFVHQFQAYAPRQFTSISLKAAKTVSKTVQEHQSIGLRTTHKKTQDGI